MSVSNATIKRITLFGDKFYCKSCENENGFFVIFILLLFIINNLYYEIFNYCVMFTTFTSLSLCRVQIHYYVHFFFDSSIASRSVQHRAELAESTRKTDVKTLLPLNFGGICVLSGGTERRTVPRS